MDRSPALFIYFCSWIEFSLWFGLDKWSRGKMKLWTSHDFANERCLLTCVLMVSVRARYQSLMTLSISDWISSSVPWRVFSWGRKGPHYFLPKHHIQSDEVKWKPTAALPYLIPRWHVSCSTCPWRPSPLSRLADQQWTRALTGCCQTSEIRETVWDATSDTKMI